MDKVFLLMKLRKYYFFKKKKMMYEVIFNLKIYHRNSYNKVKKVITIIIF